MTSQLDETKLNGLLTRVVGDMGASFSAALVVRGGIFVRTLL